MGRGRRRRSGIHVVEGEGREAEDGCQKETEQQTAEADDLRPTQCASSFL
jgi:hypothetical protein